MDDTSDKFFKLGMVAKRILENYKGIYAADESPNSMEKKFKKYGIKNTEENRREFRNILFETEGIYNYLGGVILHEETFTQRDASGTLLIEKLKSQGICLGIKLDKGLIGFKDDEFLSIGIEDLPLRVRKKEFSDAVFAKWRSLYKVVDELLPSDDCIEENSTVLAKYAKICQDNDIVPIVEPELFFEGDYTIHEASHHYKRILTSLIKKLNDMNVYIPAVIIKMSFVSSGNEGEHKCNAHSVGLKTLEVLISTIPCGIPGIVFLSGGHIQKDALKYLNSVNSCKALKTWTLSYSFGRTLSDEPMEIWQGKNSNKDKMQEKFLDILKLCYKSNKGTLLKNKI